MGVRTQKTSLAPRIPGRAQCVTQNPAGGGQGLIGEYGCLLVLYWDEICRAVQKHWSKNQAHELFDTMDDLRQRFRLWNDGEHQSDQRLVWSPSIRKMLIIKLTVLTLDLRPGEKMI